MTVLNELLPDFKLNGTSVSKFTFENSIVSLGTDAVLGLDLDVSASDVRTNSELDMRFSRLMLTLACDITVPAIPKAKTEVILVLEGEFASSLKMDEEQFREMLWMSGTAALYSIARSKLEAISALTYHSGKITLPMLNVIEFLKQKKAGCLTDADGQN